MKIIDSIQKYSAKIIITGVVTTALILWGVGFLQSPFFLRDQQKEIKFLSKYLEANSPDYLTEKILAESYWLRYQDVKEDSQWGLNGPMGIWGPRDHFKQFGRRNGRIFQPVIEVQDKEKEKKYAKAYWSRYPDIRDSDVWGVNSPLGIRGPRDHYHYVGRFENRIWGEVD